MRGTKVFTTVTVLMILTVRQLSKGELLSCPREQTAFVNTEKLLECTITADFYGVYWYRGKLSKDSVVRLINKLKAGPEYQSGKLDIAKNGSMIIKNVSPDDDGIYRVMVVLHAGGEVSEYISLTVIIPSSTNIPKIDRCNCKTCCICVTGPTTLVCHMDGRPAVAVKWYNASSGDIMEDQSYASELNSTSLTFNSYSRLNVDLRFQEIVEVTCASSGIAIMKALNSSVLLITPSDPYLSNQIHYFQTTDDSVSLPYHQDLDTTNASKVALVKQTTDAHFSYSPPTCIQIGCDVNESLNVLHEENEKTLYTYVVKINGTYERYLYRLFRAYPLQSSNYSLIDKCIDRENCTMHLNTKIETLTCSARETRPAADIKWEVNYQQVGIIRVQSFVSCGFNLCNSSSTITFHLRNGNSTLKCSVSGPWSKNILTSYIFVTYKVAMSEVTDHPLTDSISTVYETSRYNSDVVLSEVKDHPLTDSIPTVFETSRYNSDEPASKRATASDGSPCLRIRIVMIAVFCLLVASTFGNVILLCKLYSKRGNPPNPPDAPERIPMKSDD